MTRFGEVLEAAQWQPISTRNARPSFFMISGGSFAYRQRLALDILPTPKARLTQPATQLGVMCANLPHVISGRSVISTDIARHIEIRMGQRNGAQAALRKAQNINRQKKDRARQFAGFPMRRQRFYINNPTKLLQYSP